MFCLSFCGRKGQMDRESAESSKTQQGIRSTGDKVEVATGSLGTLGAEAWGGGGGH